MKKKYGMICGYITLLLLLNIQSLQAMQDDWLDIPFNKVGKEIQKFSASDCSRVFNNENKRLLAVIGVQPVDVITAIVCEMLDDGIIGKERLQKAAEKFIGMPIIDLFEEYKQIKNQLAHSARIGNKSISMFFSLTREERLAVELIEKMAQSQIDPNIIIMTHYMEKELKKLPSDVYDKFVKGRKSIVLDQQTMKDCSRLLKRCAMSSILTASALYFVIDAPWYVTIGGTVLTIGAQFFWLVCQHSSLLTAANNLAKQKVL